MRQAGARAATLRLLGHLLTVAESRAERNIRTTARGIRGRRQQRKRSSRVERELLFHRTRIVYFPRRILARSSSDTLEVIG